MLTPTANCAVDPDHTVPRRAVRFVSKLFDQTAPMRSGSILVASTTPFNTPFNNELVDDIWVVM